MTAWLSHGVGQNSMALTVLLCRGALPEFGEWQAIFSDTGDEKDETYAYLDGVLRPYLRRHGKELVVVRDKESVLERWERLGVVGSRILRTCTSHAKIRPIERYLAEHWTSGDVQLIGIDAGESHRARPDHPETKFPKRYPLVELGIGRRGCKEIIKSAGLCLPLKSGCWHCPFARKREVIDLAKNQPDKFQRIVELEAASIELHPPDAGKVRAQWSERPAAEWREIARREQEQGRLFDLGGDPEDLPCGCYDG